MKNNLKYIIAVAGILAVLIPGPTKAADYVTYPAGWEIVPEECLDPTGDCNINSFVQLFVNLAGIMLKVTPTLALVAFVVGGIFFIGAGGNQQRIETGKKILSSTAIGVLLIIGVGWLLSFFIVAALTGDTKQAAGKIFSGPWQQDWWTAKNTSDISTTPLQVGCCQITNYGCRGNITRPECETLNMTFDTAKGVDVAMYFQEGIACDKNTTCQNYAADIACCVPTDISSSDCQRAPLKDDNNGCLDWPDTIPRPELCNSTDQCNL